MPLEPNVKEKHSLKALVKSFAFARNGILIALKMERNLKVHYLIAIIVMLTGAYFKISQIEAIILILIIALVISLEMINTAIERTIDLLTEKEHVYAQIAKDVAAGAVLTAVLAAIIIGILIFLPYLTANHAVV